MKKINYPGKVADALRGTGDSLWEGSEGTGAVHRRGKERKWLKMKLQKCARAYIEKS